MTKIALGAFVVFGAALPAVSGDDEAKATAREELLQREPWLALADTTISRKEIRDRLVAWVGNETGRAGMLPGAPGPDVGTWIPILDRMILEDAAHQPPTSPLADLPPEERVAELIYRLRDVTRISASWADGWLDFAAPPMFGEPTAADLLVREGHAAVPALIAALGDERLTRCIAHYGRAAPPTATRVGEAAAMLLARIAGRPFHHPQTESRTRDFGASIRPVVTRWWDAVREKGEFLAVADELQTTTMPYAKIYLAWRLAKLDPHAAAPFVVRVASATADPMRRKLLLDLLDRLDGPGATEFLRRELTHGPFILHRVAAAFSLRDRGEDGLATTAIRAAWRRPLDFGTCPNIQWKRRTISLGIHQAAVFLASSKDPEVVADLGRGLDELPVAARAAVAQALAGGPDEFGKAAYYGAHRHDAGVPGIDNGVARKLLRPLLDDRGEVDDIDGLNGIVYLTPRRSMPPDTRVADMAAAALARREPDTFEFRAVAPCATRDEAIAVIRTLLDKAAGH